VDGKVAVLVHADEQLDFVGVGHVSLRSMGETLVDYRISVNRISVKMFVSI